MLWAKRGIKFRRVDQNEKFDECLVEDGNVRTLEVHPANDAAASELKQHLKGINAQYWRSSYLMKIYISVLEEDARQANKEPDLKTERI